MRILPASDASVIVTFGDTIARDFHLRVVQVFQRVHALHDDRIRNLHPAYASMIVEFDPLRMTHDEVTQLVKRLAAPTVHDHSNEGSTVDIPVCYDLEFGPDLPSIASRAGLTVEEVIVAHASADYYVCFLGFSPGFAYLGGLPPQLATPRLATPRKTVIEGSVGIAGNQTGVYPVNSPGGWQLLGRTPLRMFEPEASVPSRLQLGDRVRFRVISRDEFERLKTPRRSESIS